MNVRSLVARFCPLLIVAGAVAQDPGPYRGLIENDPLLRTIFSPRVLTVGALNETPSTYRDVPIRMVLAFESLGRIQNPFFTRFTNETYLNFGAWDAERPLWEKEAFVTPHSLFFTERDSRAAKVFATAKRFERFEVRAVVKDTFGGRAWIEVTEAKRLDKALSAAAIRHVSNGLSQLRAGRASVAAGELRQALQADLPETHRARILFFTARAYENMERDDLASPFLAEAHQLRPEDPEIRHAYRQNLAWMARRASGGATPAIAKQAIPTSENPAATANPQAAQETGEGQAEVVREAQPILIESKKDPQETPPQTQGEESKPPGQTERQDTGTNGGTSR